MPDAKKPTSPIPEPSDTVLRGKAIFAWVLLLAYVGFIYATLSSVPDFREWLEDSYGKGIFATITYISAGIAAALVIAYLVFRKKEKRLFPYLSLILVGLFLRHIMRNWIVIPVEQIHFIEYGLVGFLSYRALRHHLRGWGLVLAAFLLAYLFGMIDETIQGNLDSRVGEQRDMYWNGLAAAMGLWVVVTSLRPDRIRGRSGRGELRASLAIAALCLPVQGFFNLDVAQFGRLIQFQEGRITFRSRLPEEKLREYNDSLDHFKRLAVQLGKVRMVLLTPQTYDRIHEEALVHLFRRMFHERSGITVNVYNEDLILKGYFPQFMAGTGLDLSPERSEEMASALGDTANWNYESPVAGHLITKFRQWQMWVVIGLLELVMGVFWFRLGRIIPPYPPVLRGAIKEQIPPTSLDKGGP